MSAVNQAQKDGTTDLASVGSNLNLPDDLLGLLQLYQVADYFILEGLLTLIARKIASSAAFLKYTNVRRVILLHFS